jgi:lipid-A-disaccharide synthase
LGNQYEYVVPVAPTLDDEFLRGLMGKQKITLVRESLPALFHSRAGIIASGTATVEAAMMNTPFVMVYRVSQLTYVLGKPRVKVPYFAMVNLIAGREVVPELVQHDFTATNVVSRISEILPEGPPRQRMLQGIALVRSKLGRGEDTNGPYRRPADRAAEIILSFVTVGASIPATH